MSYVTGRQLPIADWQATNHVMISMFLRPGSPTMSVYTDAAIAASLDLDRGGFLLLALLVGGDYDMVCGKSENTSALSNISYNQAGLPGCGIAIAHKLMHSGLGHTLLDASREQQPQGLSAASLTAWRSELRSELEHDPHGHLGRKYFKVAQSIPDNFPSEEVIMNYIQPITTRLADEGMVPPAGVAWVLRQPDLPELGLLCERYFTWATGPAILQRFNSIGMWQGVYLHLLLTVCWPLLLCPYSQISLPEQSNVGNVDADGLAGQMAQISQRICQSKQDSSAGGLLMYQVEINTAPLQAQVLSRLQGIRRASTAEAAPPVKARLWIHAPFIDHAQPGLVAQFSPSGPRPLSDWVWQSAPAPVLARPSQLPSSLQSLHQISSIHADSSGSSTVIELSDSSPDTSDATLSDSML